MLERALFFIFDATVVVADGAEINEGAYKFLIEDLTVLKFDLVGKIWVWIRFLFCLFSFSNDSASFDL